MSLRRANEWKERTCGVGTVVMKNCEPFMLRSALAMLRFLSKCAGESSSRLRAHRVSVKARYDAV
jgi:hypothetical protein